MFFIDTEDFKKYSSVSKAFNFAEITLILKEVDRKILKKYLGSSFLAELQTAFDAGVITKADPSAGEIKIKAVLELIRICTPYFGLAIWAPKGQLTIDNSGISIASSADRKTAFQWQIKDFIKSVTDSGYTALDSLLEFLELNLGDYTAYKESDAFKSNRELFVNSSTLFAKHYSAIEDSRVTYFKLKSIIRKVEDLEIKKVLLPDYYAELKELLLAGTEIDEDDQAVINLVQPAVVNLTIARAIRELAATLGEDGFIQFDNSRTSDTIDNKKSAEPGSLINMANAATEDARSYIKQLQELLAADVDGEKYETYAADAMHDSTTLPENPNDGSLNLYSAI